MSSVSPTAIIVQETRVADPSWSWTSIGISLLCLTLVFGALLALIARIWVACTRKLPHESWHGVREYGVRHPRDRVCEEYDVLWASKRIGWVVSAGQSSIPAQLLRDRLEWCSEGSKSSQFWIIPPATETNEIDATIWAQWQNEDPGRVHLLPFSETSSAAWNALWIASSQWRTKSASEDQPGSEGERSLDLILALDASAFRGPLSKEGMIRAALELETDPYCLGAIATATECWWSNGWSWLQEASNLGADWVDRDGRPTTPGWLSRWWKSRSAAEASSDLVSHAFFGAAMYRFVDWCRGEFQTNKYHSPFATFHKSLLRKSATKEKQPKESTPSSDRNYLRIIPSWTGWATPAG